MKALLVKDGSSRKVFLDESGVCWYAVWESSDDGRCAVEEKFGSRVGVFKYTHEKEGELTVLSEGNRFDFMIVKRLPGFGKYGGDLLMWSTFYANKKTLL